MIKKYLRNFIPALLLIFTISAQSQDHLPFWNEIRQFQVQDSLQMPPKNAILFVGSSSFRLWKGLQDSFPSHSIINRGFGGSSLVDVIRYEEDLIFKYQPRQVVIYCGENDIASSDSITGKIVFERFKQLFNDIRARYPKIPVAFVSMKPSPSRWHMKDRLEEGNELVKKFLQKQKNTKYIDIWKPMLDKNGEPMKELFVQDNLHMNAKGYAIWKEAIRPYLRQKRDGSSR